MKSFNSLISYDDMLPNSLLTSPELNVALARAKRILHAEIKPSTSDASSGLSETILLSFLPLNELAAPCPIL